ncbi:MAG: MaoC family dehydratase N-terminal domain-containing protein [Rhodospirillales bacterium]|nr:MaoC family dehydratase N-terminal domain-containing protein [Rhodospirillales bacterium]
MVAADADLRAWIGRSETASERMDPGRAQALDAALDRSGPPIEDGDELPPLRHWLYFWPCAASSGLGRDGHPLPGGFLPDVGAARRMWAGGRLRFEAPLIAGAQVRRTSTIASVSEKAGRSGRLVFVTVRHDFEMPAGLALVEEQDIVYRQQHGDPPAPHGDDGADAPAPGPPAAPIAANAACGQPMRADPVLLFRYSALTFNAHRIHYDRDYATGVEGYAGLVVHGPLLATLLIDAVRAAWPAETLRSFAFRGLRPVIDGALFTINARRDGPAADAWIETADRQAAMRARAVLG